MKLETVRTWYDGKYGCLCKLVVGISILSCFALSLNTAKIGKAIGHISLVEIAILTLLAVARNAVGAIRFRILSAIIRKIPFVEILKQYFVASLFNNFLPTSLGGDGVRFVMASDCGLSKSEAGVLILLERVIGFYALVTISMTSALFWSPPPNVFTLVIWLFVLYSGLMTILFFDVFGLARRTTNRHLEALRVAFARCQRKHVALTATFALSLLYQFISVSVSYYVATAIGVKLSITVFLTFVPLVWCFTMIPISLGGIGLREVSFAYLFSLVGIPKEDSLIVSLATYLTLVISGTIGAVFLLFGTKKDNG